MHNHSRRRFALTLSTAIALCAALSAIPQILAQSPELQEKLAQIKQSSAANKQALAHYTWLEQQTISLKGDVKKTQQFQVRIGPDGQQQKTALNPQAPPPSKRKRTNLRRTDSKSPPSASNTLSLTCRRSSRPISKAISRCSRMALQALSA